MRDPAKPFGTATLTCLVVANMIGVGVFTTSGLALRDLGRPAVVWWAWVVAGVIALAGAVSYGRLVRAFPESGGEYVFLARALHPGVGFVAGWISIIAGFSGAIALAATTFEHYVLPNPPPGWPTDALAIAVVVAGGLTHGWTVRGGAALQNASVVLKIAVLLALIGAAAWQLPDGWRGIDLPQPLPTPDGLPWAAFAGSLVWISLSYSGFNAAVYVAEESRAAELVPRALWRGTLIVTVLYLALNAVFLYAPPPDAILGREDIAAIAAEALAGPGAAVAIRAVIALALWTSISSMMMAAPRVIAKMAEDDFLPHTLRLIERRPRAALAAQAAIAIGLILVSELQGLLGYLGLTLSLCAAAAVACLFRLPASTPTRWLTRIAAGVYVGGTLVAAGALIARDPGQVLGTVVTAVAGGALYVLGRHRRRNG